MYLYIPSVNIVISTTTDGNYIQQIFEQGTTEAYLANPEIKQRSPPLFIFYFNSLIVAALSRNNKSDFKMGEFFKF